MKEKVTH